MTLSKLLSIKFLSTIAIALPLFFLAPIANAQNKAAVDEMAGYLDFIEYESPRVLRRHYFLREYCHEKIKYLFPRSP